MSISRIAKTSAAGNSGGATTPAVNTTGANLLILATSQYDSGAIVSDSKNNTWVALTAKGFVAFARAQFWYCKNPVVGAGHTFSALGAASYCSLAVSAYSGARILEPFDVENGDDNGAHQPGIVTPGYDNSLIVTVAGNQSLLTSTIEAGFTVQQQVAYANGNNYGIAFADKIQTTKHSENPVWVNNDASLIIAVFREEIVSQFTDFGSTQVNKPHRVGTSLPSTARKGEIFILVGSSVNKMYASFAVDTWSEIGAAGGASSIAIGTPPTLSTDPGTTGQIAFDGAFLYICVATNTWLRAPLSDWPQ